MQMLFAAMLIYAFHAAFEDRKVTLDRVAVHRAIFKVDVLSATVRRSAVPREMFAHRVVTAVFVGHY